MMATMNLAYTPGNDRYWWLAALAFGLLVLPYFVYVTGTTLLGAYASGGALGFYGDFARGLATLRWYSWTMALGPLAIVATWRGLWRLAA
jgi:hypothetical protein